MASFGEGLKREREKKKITLDQVSLSTKISVRMLRALEADEFDQLPGGIFNKGFVRAYARYLGLDEEQTVAGYVGASNPVATPPPEDLELRAMAEQKDKERQRQAHLTRDFPWGSLATLLLLVAVGLSIWGVRSGRTSPSRKAAASQAPVSGQDQSAKPVASSSPLERSRPGAENASPADKEVSPGITPVASEEARLAPSAETGGSFTVLVTAETNSWLSITADGKPIFSGTLIAPGEQLVRARDAIVIRAEKVAGLEFDFNGKRLPHQVDQVEGKTLVFRMSGLVTQAAGRPE